MRPAAKCATAVLCIVLLLPVLGWGTQHAPTQQSKEQARPATESREQYQKRIGAKLDELGRQISALEAKEEAQADQARRGLRKELTQQHQAAARQYEELKQEGEEAWKKMKPQVDAALDELEKAYDRLASRFQEH